MHLFIGVGNPVLLIESAYRPEVFLVTVQKFLMKQTAFFCSASVFCVIKKYFQPPYRSFTAVGTYFPSPCRSLCRCESISIHRIQVFVGVKVIPFSVWKSLKIWEVIIFSVSKFMNIYEGIPVFVQRSFLQLVVFTSEDVLNDYERHC